MKDIIIKIILFVPGVIFLLFALFVKRDILLEGWEIKDAERRFNGLEHWKR